MTLERANADAASGMTLLSACPLIRDKYHNCTFNSTLPLLKKRIF